MPRQESYIYEFGEFRLSAVTRLLSRRGETIPLTPKALDLLLALVEQHGQLLDKQTLLNTVWPDSFVEENNLADNIFKLRRVLGDGEGELKFIETVPKRGYRFVAAVRHVQEEPGPRLEAPEPAGSESRSESQRPQSVIRSAGSRRPPAGWFFAGAMALLLVALLAVAALRQGRVPEQSHPLRTSLLPPEGAAFGEIAVSPDGKWLAFTASRDDRIRLWLQSLTSGEATEVEGSDGAVRPFWSPDSASVAFFAAGKLKKVGIDGSSPATLCLAWSATGGTWNQQGVILYTLLGVPGIQRVSASGGTPDTVLQAAPGQTDLHEPVFLPDGRRFLYLATSNGRQDLRGIFVGSFDGTASQRVFDHDANVLYVAGGDDDGRGYLLFGRDGGLVAQRFDTATLRVSGPDIPIADRLGTIQGATNLSYRRRTFTASANGLLIYDAHADRTATRMLWVDRAGKPLRVLADVDNVSVPALSPDGKRVVVARKNLATNDNDLWLTDVSGGNPVRFTFDPGSDILGLWAPDGRRIVWTSSRNGSFDLYEKAASHDGKDTLLLGSKEYKFPLDWSRDGRYLLFRQTGTHTAGDLFVLPTTGDRKPFVYLQTSAMENGGAFSPDGNWIAYSSDEAEPGRFEVYVERFPTHGGKRQVTSTGGTAPRWRADGRELYYYSLDGRLTALTVTDDGGILTTGTPTALFAFRPASTVTYASYVVADNGQSFLLSALVETAPEAALSVVQNWTVSIER
jgi:Tol biopolymer transport system component/DNA-binding winged helix-turn-helix (wHTH) protein